MYRRLSNSAVLRLKDGACIPFSEGNADYREYCAWVEAGGVAEAVVILPPSIPQKVTKYQGKAALLKAGLLPTVEAYMLRPETSELMKLAWREAQSFEREGEMVLGMAELLKLTKGQLDDLFVYADTVV